MKNQIAATNFLEVNRIITFTLLLLGIIFLQACQNPTEENTLHEQEQEHPNIIKLKNQSAEFTPEIVKLNEDVYAVGYDGNPTNLYPLSMSQEAKHMIELAGGEQKMFTQLNKAAEVGDYQWGLQLADYLLQADYEKTKVIKKLSSTTNKCPCKKLLSLLFS